MIDLIHTKIKTSRIWASLQLAIKSSPLAAESRRSWSSCRSSRRRQHKGWWRRPPARGLRWWEGGPDGRSPRARIPDIKWLVVTVALSGFLVVFSMNGSPGQLLQRGKVRRAGSWRWGGQRWQRGHERRCPGPPRRRSCPRWRWSTPSSSWSRRCCCPSRHRARPPAVRASSRSGDWDRPENRVFLDWRFNQSRLEEEGSRCCFRTFYRSPLLFNVPDILIFNFS